ncbi:MAG: hypothetical protein ACR2J8_12355 [Thermomicrobiales bacterium]
MICAAQTGFVASPAVTTPPGEDGGVNETWQLPADDETIAQDALFGWRGSGIVLFGDYRNERWTVSRGWIEGDSLANIRRWTFAAPSAFAGQVRRLVLEATNDGTIARVAGGDALRWAQHQTASESIA